MYENTYDELKTLEENKMMKTLLEDIMWYCDPEEGVVCVECGVRNENFYPIVKETIHRRDCRIAKILGLTMMK